jgi:PEGA domain-containing protein
MKVPSDLASDRFPETDSAPTTQTLASWYAPGLSDELGDRLLMFDNSSAPSLELLRFRRVLTSAPGFETALRRRVEQLSNFRHPTFATVRAVEHLGGGDGLALLSNYTPGKRLSEILHNARGPAFATALIQQLAPALASLRQHGDGTGHGALDVNRIIVTPEGRLMIGEHVLAWAVERLQLRPGLLRSELGIAVPPRSGPDLRLDIRIDYYQLGLIALSLLLGRSLRPDEPLEEVGSLLRQVAQSADRESPLLFRRLRVWLESALQLNGQMFRSPAEAHDRVEELTEKAASHRALRAQPVRALPSPAAETVRAVSPNPSTPDPIAIGMSAAPPADAIESNELPLRSEASDTNVTTSASSPADAPDRNLEPPENAELPRDGWHGAAVLKVPKGGRRAVQSLVAALALCVMGEGFVIATLVQKRSATLPPPILLETLSPGADVVVDGRVAGTTPVQLNLGTETRSIRVVESRPKPPDVAAPVPEPPASPSPMTDVRKAAVPAAAPQRFGGIRLVSPIELEVFDGDARLGSSATGIVSARAGRRELDLVNTGLGYRVRRVVDVRGGQVVPLEVSLPNGRLSINATPWAEVWIDGKSVGETPLGNLSVPLGEHEIVFRHPQFGELRRTAIVRLDVVTRVTANLQR